MLSIHKSSSSSSSSSNRFAFLLSFLLLVVTTLCWSVAVLAESSSSSSSSNEFEFELDNKNNEFYNDFDDDNDDDDAFTIGRVFFLRSSRTTPSQEQQDESRHRHLQTGSTSTSTSVNIFTQLRESLGLTIVGIILICLVPCFIWKNEQRHVMELSRIDFCNKTATTVTNADAPSTELNEKLVHFTGTVVAGGEVGLEFGSSSDNNDNKDDNNHNNRNNNNNNKDDKLNVTSPVPKALMLKRTCYIYQKFEDAQQSTEKKLVGGGETRTTTYTVREDWTAAGPQPASLEHLKDEHNVRGQWDAIVLACGAGGGGDTAAAAAAITGDDAAPKGLSPGLLGMMAMLNNVNPTTPPHGYCISPAAHVGGYALSSDVMTTHPHVFATEWLPVPAEFVPDQVPGVESQFVQAGNVLTDVVNGQPKNGDIKIVYEYVVDGFDCSFIVQQVPAAASPATVKSKDDGAAAAGAEPDIAVTAGGNNNDDDNMMLFGMKQYSGAVDEKCLGQCKTDLGDVWYIQRGHHDLAAMIKMATEQENLTVKILRVVCWVLLCAGWCMLFAPFVTALSVLPLLAQLGGFAVFVVGYVYTREQHHGASLQSP
jgi:Transmembrane protein 43